MYTLIICWYSQFKIVSHTKRKDAEDSYEVAIKQDETLAAFVYYQGQIMRSFGVPPKED